MSLQAAEIALSEPPREADRRVVVTALGLTQILAWGSTYYLPAVLGVPIAAETGWPLSVVVGGLSLGLLTAGMVSPRVGRAIQARGGRPVLALGSVLLAAGLALIGLSQNLPVYFAAWIVLGAGMGCGLYDAAFSTLGRLYGREARRAITSVTLFGGLASTVCWPLSAYMAETLGWRGACLVYAGLHLGVALPLHLLALPRVPPEIAPTRAAAGGRRSGIVPRDRLPAYLMLAGILTLTALITSVVAVHLLTILQTRGLDLAAAVALGTLIGPAQVGSRLIEMAFGHRYHPIWTMVAAAGLIAVGLISLRLDLAAAAASLVLYGLGTGIYSIARGTLPLALFGPQHYARLIGQLARPAMLASALAPSLGALLLEAGGPRLALGALAGAALLNAALVAALRVVGRGAAAQPS